MDVYDRSKKKVVSYKNTKSLVFLYRTFFGRIILWIIKHRIFSIIYGKYNDSNFSKYKISSFIKNNNIDMSEYEEKKYSSFNDFFTRKILFDKRPMNKSKTVLISPADSKLIVYQINNNTIFKIKNSEYSISSLIQDEKTAKLYVGGVCLVFRLGVEDFHRYCFIDDGTLVKQKYIPGFLHTVNPIAFDTHKVFLENCREISILNTDNFEEVIQIEVGALFVGKINNHKKTKYHKGEEKGYFSFGGSTIVLLFKKNIIKIDNDIIENSIKNIETIIKYGETIGKRK